MKNKIIIIFLLSFCIFATLFLISCEENLTDQNKTEVSTKYTTKEKTEKMQQKNELQFSRESAYNHCKNIVDLSPRVSGTESHKRVRSYIKNEIEKNNLKIIEDIFVTKTPVGDVEMDNITTTIKGSEENGNKIILAAHYDSKYFKDEKFLGANDNASGVAVLLELLKIVKEKKYKYDIEFLFLDGEEAFANWSDTDSLYGSRRYVSQIKNIRKINAVILLDMVGEKNIKIDFDMNSSPELTDILIEATQDLNLTSCFSKRFIAIEDDHIPFVTMGIPAIDIIDFEYDDWHTKNDNMENISSKSLENIGLITLKMLDILNK